jgi:hypothetical protein
MFNLKYNIKSYVFFLRVLNFSYLSLPHWKRKERAIENILMVGEERERDL